MRVKLGLLGASGRMGRQVVSLLEGEYASRAGLSAAVSEGDPLEPLLDADAVIDFSLPLAMSRVAELALSRSGELPAFAVGSTGWTAEQRKTLDALAARTEVLVASNFSTGVTALLAVLRQASPVLAKLGYTPVIAETHHKYKKDAPSGTALSLARAISPEAPDSVQTVSVRAGEIIGDHEVTFYGPSDHLTLGHFAQDRSLFARGAIDVALMLASRRGSGRAGMVTMGELFGGI